MISSAGLVCRIHCSYHLKLSLWLGVLVLKRFCLVESNACRRGRCAVVNSCIRTTHQTILALVVAATSLFGGGFAAQAEPATPDSAQCSVNAELTKATCTGDLSKGVRFSDAGGELSGFDKYVLIEVRDVDGNIEQLDNNSGTGIYYVVFGNSNDIEIDVDTGDNQILASGTRSRGVLARAASRLGVESGNLAVRMNGDITLQGRGSSGIYAESEDKGVAVHMTGDIDVSGDDTINGVFAEGGGDNMVMVAVDGNITVKGDYSRGIFANSVGNGSVLVDMQGKIVVDGDCYQYNCSQGIGARNNGSSTVNLKLTGNIIGKGLGTRGIYAASFDDISEGESGDVLVEVEGDVKTSGLPFEDDKDRIHGSEAIFAESRILDDLEFRIGNIEIVLHGGNIISENDDAIEFYGGRDNKLSIYNNVKISGGGFDVRGGVGNEGIENFGVLTSLGKIDLGSGTNTFKNHSGAIFLSGESIVLGGDHSDLFSNAGNWSPGGASSVRTTNLTGNFQNFITDDQDSRKMGTITVTIDDNGSDRIDIVGKATLNGGMVKVADFRKELENGKYTFLHATDSVEGRFDGTIGSFLKGYKLSYDGSSVALSFESIDAAFSDFATTSNQRALAMVLDKLPDDNKIAVSVRDLNTFEQAQVAYDSLSGKSHASLKGTLMRTAQMQFEVINRRLAERSSSVTGGKLSMTANGDAEWPTMSEISYWADSYGGLEESNSSGHDVHMELDRYGVIFGFNRRLSEGWNLGALWGYGRTQVRQHQLQFSDVDTWTVGFYGSHESGALRIGLGASYNVHAVDTSRSVHIANSTQELSASYNTRSLQFFAEAGHKLQAGSLTLEPFAGVSNFTIDTEGFSETGGNAALTASSKIDRTTLAKLGLRGTMQLDDKIRLRGKVGQWHALSIAAPSSFHSLSGQWFKVKGMPTMPDGLDVGMRIEANLSNKAVLALAYEGSHGDTDVHGLNTELKLLF